MDQMAHNQFFPRMKILPVYLYLDDIFVERPHYSDNAVYSFRVYPPLKQLAIYGPTNMRVSDVILCNHEQKL